MLLPNLSSVPYVSIHADSQRYFITSFWFFIKKLFECCRGHIPGPRLCVCRSWHKDWIHSLFRTKDSKSKWIFGEVLDPRNSTIRRYNKWFLLSCVLGAAVDPLFISVLSINKDLSCLYVQKGYAIGVTILRCMVDLVYIWHMWLQLKLAYVSKKSLFLGQGELVWDARTVAIQYLRSLPQFWFDIFVILPIPQVENSNPGYSEVHTRRDCNLLPFHCK